ncbi:hypothetical protein [Dactylosporangium sp. CA-233914]|uniref:hypothetical protein n=1 Tax=Dactylosporangium sp. CA-233914 TaxID=3239934 RepID=UPI003D8B1340
MFDAAFPYFRALIFECAEFAVSGAKEVEQRQLSWSSGQPESYASVVSQGVSARPAAFGAAR